MPLAFESESHGTIAFGFFNIETDMLLLDRIFFFATDFCRGITAAALSEKATLYEKIWTIYEIPYSRIGDLHGAIAGTRFSGFIGEVYRKFPFPESPERFKQNPDGFTTRSILEEIVATYGKKREIPFRIDEGSGKVEIGDYHFTIPQFHALLRYVWRGGYPRWKGERRPPYVMEMKQAFERSPWPVFNGLRLESCIPVNSNDGRVVRV